MSIYSMILFPLILCLCTFAVHGKRHPKVNGALVGISASGGQIDLIKLDPASLESTVLFANVTPVSEKGITPEFSTAYCSDTENYLIAINDMGAPRVVGIDMRTGKVIGVIKVNGVFVNNLECDTKTGFGIAYVFLLGYKHTVVRLNFVSESHQVLMSSSYKSYGGSAVDSDTGHFFTVAVLPHFDAFNYSISILKYREGKETLTPPFRGYSIGDMVFDKKFGLPLAVVQTPPQLKEGPNYTTYLAVLDVSRGIVKALAGGWPGQQPISKTGLTFDPDSRTAYVIMEKYIRAVNMDSGLVLYSKSTKNIPWPVLYYQWM